MTDESNESDSEGPGLGIQPQPIVERPNAKQGRKVLQRRAAPEDNDEEDDEETSIEPQPVDQQPKGKQRGKKVPQRLASPEDDSPGEEKDEEPIPVVKTVKKSKPSAEKVRTSMRGIKASEKRRENDETALALDEAKLKALQKRIAKGKAQKKADDVAARVHNNEGPESEDEQEVTNGFSSNSIKILPTANSESAAPAPAPKKLRRIPAGMSTALAAPLISSRTFLLLPDSGTRSSSPALQDDMESLLPDDTTSTIPTHQTSSHGSRKRPASPSTVPNSPHKKSKTPLLKTAAFNINYTPSVGSKAKVSDYVETVEALLLRSMREYESLISTEDAFPSAAQQAQWVQICWKNACITANEHYEITERMTHLIKARGSRTRGETLGHVRSLIVPTYSFSRQTTPKAISRNVLLSAELIANGAYHSKNPSTLEGFAQNKIISEVIHISFFGNAQSVGIIYSRLFNPISLSTMALIFTLIEHCLKEWSTGRYVRTGISEATLIKSYRVHEIDLQAWNSLKPSTVENMRKKLYIRARRNAGVIDDLAPVTHIVGAVETRIRDELDGHSGETDSEMSGISDA